MVSPGHHFLQGNLINDGILAAHIADLNRIWTLFLRKKDKEVGK